jgi:hypothetical protein
MYLIRTGGVLEELPEGRRAELRGHDVVFFDQRGREIQRCDRDTVMMFGNNDRLKEYAVRGECALGKSVVAARPRLGSRREQGMVPR